MSNRAEPHAGAAPSEWVTRWSHLLPAGGTALDVACGHGRHMRWLASLGLSVTGVDRSPEALEAARHYGETVLADIEGAAWPFAGRRFDAVVVTHYLWRALLPILVESVSSGGVLIYETFATGNETVGKPSRPDFLLAHAELLAVCSDLRIVAYEDGFLDGPARFVQRIVAIRTSADALLRSPLAAPKIAPAH